MHQYIWLLLTIFCLTWYLVITGFIVFKGAGDIKKMLMKIKEHKDEKGD